MDAIMNVVSSAFTVVSFVVFIGIVGWAYSAHRRERFEQAANAPFALPDDAIGAPNIAERQS
jgi:cytochrome c oxidase cbb3-type subunit 4